MMVGTPVGRRLIARVISLGWPSPTPFVAMTRSVYVWPPVRFVMVWVSVSTATVSSDTSAGTVQLPVERFHWTLYPMMSDPPLPMLERSWIQSWIIQEGACQRRLSSPAAVEEAVRLSGGAGATAETTAVVALWIDSKLLASSKNATATMIFRPASTGRT